MIRPTHCAMALALACSAALAQTAPPATQPADSRIDRLEQRFDDMQKKYEADLKNRDEEIARLKSQLSQPTSQPAAPAAAGTSADDISKATQDMLKDIESKESAPPIVRVPASFNPNFAVIGDFAGNASSVHNNAARNRYDLREIELDLRAAVDPRADAVVILPIDREVADPLFFNPAARPSGDIDTSIDIEEAYLNIHDFGIPNLTAKLGRFHLRFGRWNLLHLHNWPTVDNAFVVQSFLGPESLVDSGVSFSYQIPPSLIHNEYVEADAEIISGVGDSDDPVLNNNGYVSTPGINLHVLWNHDLTQNINFELGASFLHGHHNTAANQYANVFGTDFTLMHTDPTGRFNNQLFQTEVMYGNTDNGANNPQHSLGAFIIAQQQLNRDWYTGVRLDWTKNAIDEHQEVWGVSPYLTWYWSEFLMFRAEYQHKSGDVPTEDNLWFQCDFVFGAHPPHPYWAAK